MVSPGAGGAHNWNPMAFSPLTGLVYVPVTETYMAYAAAESFDPARGGLGTSFTGFDAERRQIAEYADAHSRGWLSAWDPRTQREVWRGPVEQEGQRRGAGDRPATSVFQGTIGTTFRRLPRRHRREGLGDAGAASARSPRRSPTRSMASSTSRSTPAGVGASRMSSAHSTPSCSCRSRGCWCSSSAAPRNFRRCPASSMVVPELSPPAAADRHARAGGARRADSTAKTAGCATARPARGGVKDLRHMMPATQAAFLDIVLGGTRAQNGMASFADVLVASRPRRSITT
jgi:quinohemoprotein ethanol dehydrogenase